MLIYTVEYLRGEDHTTQKTLHIEGKADLDERLKLHAALLDALFDCDRLTLNLENVTYIDASFVFLVCSIHQAAQLVGKQLVLEGVDTEAFLRDCEQIEWVKNGECEFSLTDQCSLWGCDRHLAHRAPGKSGKGEAGVRAGGPNPTGPK
jgi:anti-anti-sigma regulatory factor